MNKRQVIGELCRLSVGGRITELKGGRAKELTELWKQGLQDLPDYEQLSGENKMDFQLPRPSPIAVAALENGEEHE